MNIEDHLRHIGIDAGSVEPVTMSRAAVSCPVARLSAFYATIFLVTGIQLPYWPVWLVSRGFGAREIGLLLAAGIWVKVLVTPASGRPQTGPDHIARLWEFSPQSLSSGTRR